MQLADDTARFAPDDGAEHVLASLACRFCLGAPSHVDLKWDTGVAVARSTCGHCAEVTVLACDGEQATRLALAAPCEVRVRAQRPL